MAMDFNDTFMNRSKGLYDPYGLDFLGTVVRMGEPNVCMSDYFSVALAVFDGCKSVKNIGLLVDIKSTRALVYLLLGVYNSLCESQHCSGGDFKQLRIANVEEQKEVENG